MNLRNNKAHLDPICLVGNLLVIIFGGITAFFSTTRAGAPEVLVAMFVLTFGILGTLPLFYLAIDIGTECMVRQASIILARSKLSEIKAWRNPGTDLTSLPTYTVSSWFSAFLDCRQILSSMEEPRSSCVFSDSKIESQPFCFLFKMVKVIRVSKFAPIRSYLNYPC